MFSNHSTFCQNRPPLNSSLVSGYTCELLYLGLSDFSYLGLQLTRWTVQWSKVSYHHQNWGLKWGLVTFLTGILCHQVELEIEGLEEEWFWPWDCSHHRGCYFFSCDVINSFGSEEFVYTNHWIWLASLTCSLACHFVTRGKMVKLLRQKCQIY